MDSSKISLDRPYLILLKITFFAFKSPLQCCICFCLPLFLKSIQEVEHWNVDLSISLHQVLPSLSTTTHYAPPHRLPSPPPHRTHSPNLQLLLVIEVWGKKVNRSATTNWSCLQKMYSGKQEMFKAIKTNIFQHHSQTPDVTRVSAFEPATTRYLSHNLFP